jgi:hypothetical protein
MIHVAATAVSRRYWDASPEDGGSFIRPQSIVWVMKDNAVDFMGPYVCINALGRILYDPVNREEVEMSPDDLPYTPHSVIDSRLEVEDRNGRRKADTC